MRFDEFQWLKTPRTSSKLLEPHQISSKTDRSMSFDEVRWENLVEPHQTHWSISFRWDLMRFEQFRWGSRSFKSLKLIKSHLRNWGIYWYVFDEVRWDFLTEPHQNSSIDEFTMRFDQLNLIEPYRNSCFDEVNEIQLIETHRNSLFD